MNGYVIYCCVTTYPKSWGLKATKMYCFPLFWASDTRGGLGLAWLGGSSPFGISLSQSLSCNQLAAGLAGLEGRGSSLWPFSVSLFMWLTWAASQHGGLRGVRLTTW